VKRDKTLVERWLDFADAAKVIDGHQYTLENDRQDYPEPRLVTVGNLNLDRMVMVVSTPRNATTRQVMGLYPARGKYYAPTSVLSGYFYHPMPQLSFVPIPEQSLQSCLIKPQALIL
jgi:uncharacterized DUF497 family protein